MMVLRRHSRADLLNVIVETELVVDELLRELAGVRYRDECRVILQDTQAQLRYSHRTHVTPRDGLTGNNEAKALEWTTARAENPSVLCPPTRTRR